MIHCKQLYSEKTQINVKKLNLPKLSSFSSKSKKKK